MDQDKREPEMETVREMEPVAEEPEEEKDWENETEEMMDDFVSLLNEDKARDFRSRWQTIQTGFVDDPRSSVEKADELVESVMDSITETFANERSSLEEHWNKGTEASTEDLRLAIKRYRSFFNRLLSLETSES